MQKLINGHCYQYTDIDETDVKDISEIIDLEKYPFTLDDDYDFDHDEFEVRRQKTLRLMHQLRSDMETENARNAELAHDNISDKNDVDKRNCGIKDRKIYKRALQCGLAAAAAIAIMILAAPPVRKNVEISAGNAFHSFQNIVDDIFSVSVTKQEGDCKIDINKLRAYGDMISFSSHENYSGDGVPRYVYSVVVRDDKGGSAFSMSTFEKNDTKKNPHEHHVYIDGLRSIVNSYDKNYTCTITVDIYDSSVADGEKLSSLDFDFALKNVKSVIEAEEYLNSYKFTFRGQEMRIEKLVYTPTEIYTVFEETEQMHELYEHFKKKIPQLISEPIKINSDDKSYWVIELNRAVFAPYIKSDDFAPAEDFEITEYDFNF